jgi:hypothetical protein
MNLFDVIFFSTLAICVASGYAKGFIKSLFDLSSIFIALLISNTLHPIISNIIKQHTNIYYNISQRVISQVYIPNQLDNLTLASQSYIINNMEIPYFLTNKILINNNHEMYAALNVTRFEDYLGAYIANLFINFIAIISVYISNYNNESFRLYT